MNKDKIGVIEILKSRIGLVSLTFVYLIGAGIIFWLMFTYSFVDRGFVQRLGDALVLISMAYFDLIWIDMAIKKIVCGGMKDEKQNSNSI